MRLLIIILLLANIVYPKPTDVERRIDALEKSIQKLSHYNDSLISINAKLVEKSEDNEKIIDRFDKFNTYILAVAGIILALFIVFGLFNAWSSKENLKESQKLLDDMKSNMKTLFKKYLIKSRNELINSALLSLENKEESKRINNEAYINAHMHEGFNDSQINRIIRLFKEDYKLNINGNNFLLESLLYTDNVQSDDLFVEIISTQKYLSIDKFYFKYAMIYFGKHNKLKYLDDIAKTVIRENLIIRVAQDLEPYTPFLIALFNNEYLALNSTAKEVEYAMQIEREQSFEKKFDFTATRFYIECKKRDPAIFQ